MRPTLQNWINAADALRQLRLFSIRQLPVHLAPVQNRYADYYTSLVGELFRNMRENETPQSDWAQLGNAFLQLATETTDYQPAQHGIAKEDAVLFAAASFYLGNYPASAYLAMRLGNPPSEGQSFRAACFDFLARPTIQNSDIAINIREILLTGNQTQLHRLVAELLESDRRALDEGPESWIASRLIYKLVDNFSQSNIRDVLPDGYLEFWNPLVSSLISRQPQTWEFFPSQIEAIRGGLLDSDRSYSLQMPTGAGKTTLCETLLYWHLKKHPEDVAIMLVPYRSLASELRDTLVRRLNSFGLASRCAYGGTVPTGEEIHGLDDTRAVIATPEALSGLLGAESDFANRIKLVICDEGHLLDSGGRGIGLELLLARLKARNSQQSRFVFMSAIVPNIEEINSWLGGTKETVIQSTYRPAIAEFAVLKSVGQGTNAKIGLEMHPHETTGRKFIIEGFLEKSDYSYLNPVTKRFKTLKFDSLKVLAIGAARKALPMGPTAIFAANKRGDQGAIGIAESLVKQLQEDLPLPKPINFAIQDALEKVVAYMTDEYALNWNGTQCVKNGAVLHHGDIPQETREVLEKLIRNQQAKFVICTSTLAEGVNLPIRTLILYSVQRSDSKGRRSTMLARDIKNLVGRTGRAGANTKGLVICANAKQWQYVQPVAMQGAGETVKGSLFQLVNDLTEYLTENSIHLSNEFMEFNNIIHPVIDGVDATLIELLSDEIGEEEFVALATDLADQTLAAQQLSDESNANLRSIFALRAKHLIELRTGGKIAWARETGAKARLIDSVEQKLFPLRADWHNEVDPLSEELQKVIFEWAWTHSELQESVKKCFRLGENIDPETVKDRFFMIARCWMTGMQFKDIANAAQMTIDDLLSIHSLGIAFSLQTLVEQGINLLEKRLEVDEIELAEGIWSFPEHLRFGCPTEFARLLAASGVRHRKAFVQLGNALQSIEFSGNQIETKLAALALIEQRAAQWRTALGELVYQNTLLDLSRD